jgi:mevalonate kinase
MPAITSSAPGKIILFGEHAVVYGQPAIAVPVMEVSARAVITPLIGQPSNHIQIQDPAFDLENSIKDLPVEHAINRSIELTLKELGITSHPAFKVQLSSTIPLAAGMGSGAAISTAIIRSISTFLGASLEDEVVNQITFEIEKIHHGTPSGIDNTVITYQLPIFYIKGQTIEMIELEHSYDFVLADTGLKSSTASTVGDVRKAWQENPEKYNALFEACGDIALEARSILSTGDEQELGNLMDENHKLLQKMDVSSPELDLLCKEALNTGAFGAKLSGGGRGGIMIALVTEESSQDVADALLDAGSVNTITTRLGPRNE